MRGTKPHMKASGDAVRDMAAPRWLSKDARAEWDRVMPILTERRILTVADLGSLENYVIAIGQVREMERELQKHGHIIEVNDTPKRNPAVGIQSDAMTRARLLAAGLGPTPGSGSRPAIRDDDDDDSLLA